ncbi:MAG: tagaturonate reductase [Gorillibacterium sp.]|nr:tagaturonate reductase [Gorillibacterium sp.]
MDKTTELQLNQTCLTDSEQEKFAQLHQDPITILQVGEGNFLRGFFDWMIQQARNKGVYHGSIVVTQPIIEGKPMIDGLKHQDGLYTLVLRGLENGLPVERKERISVFSAVLNPYEQWEGFLKLAENPDLQVVVSNTTEAGLVYRPEVYVEGQPITTYPGKMTQFLYRRFIAFDGAADKGLLFLPCELIDRNGDELLTCILRYCADWELPQAFIRWVKEHNQFLCTLVDRIVTGYPTAEAEAWFEEWGHRDKFLCTAEPYHFWAIEGDPKLEEKLPLQRAGLNVHWVKDLTPYRLRKVRLLNGAHTLMTPLAILYGLGHVREVMENEEFNSFVRRVMQDEVIPSVPLPEQELKEYAETIYERFLNPFIHHRLFDIAMNSISKFKARLLPSLLFYSERNLPLPQGLTRSLAGLLRYYKVNQTEQGYAGTTLTGALYTVRDEGTVLAAFAGIWQKENEQSQLELAQALLSSKDIWEKDLSLVNGLAERIVEQWQEMESNL